MRGGYSRVLDVTSRGRGCNSAEPALLSGRSNELTSKKCQILRMETPTVGRTVCSWLSVGPTLSSLPQSCRPQGGFPEGLRCLSDPHSGAKLSEMEDFLLLQPGTGSLLARLEERVTLSWPRHLGYHGDGSLLIEAVTVRLSLSRHGMLSCLGRGVRREKACPRVHPGKGLARH